MPTQLKGQRGVVLGDDLVNKSFNLRKKSLRGQYDRTLKIESYLSVSTSQLLNLTKKGDTARNRGI